MKGFTKGYRFLLYYILILIGIGAWQLIDWYFGSEDPTWHLFFYVMVLPVVSFGFGLIAGEKPSPWIYPFVSLFLTALMYITMGNGGFCSPEGSLQISFPSFLGCAVAVAIRRIHAWLASRNK